MSILQKSSGFAWGAAIGAMTMFILDPDKGPRRRALARDRLNHWYVCAADFISAGSRDLNNRTRGWSARISRPFRGRTALDDASRTREVSPQGEGRQTSGRAMTPAAQLLLAIAGGAIALRAVRHMPLGLLATVGAGLLFRSVSEQDQGGSSGARQTRSASADRTLTGEPPSEASAVQDVTARPRSVPS
jgi:hypothetical protein